MGTFDDPVLRAMGDAYDALETGRVRAEVAVRGVLGAVAVGDDDTAAPAAELMRILSRLDDVDAALVGVSVAWAADGADAGHVREQLLGCADDARSAGARAQRLGGRMGARRSAGHA